MDFERTVKNSNGYFRIFGALVISTVIALFFYGCSEKTKVNRNVHSVQLSNMHFTGTFHDNISNKERQGSGFTPLVHSSYPNQNIYHDNAVGLNFEHIMNGAAKDKSISMFTPRKDSCSIERLSDTSVKVKHQAKHSSWNIESSMTYSFTGENYIDLEFNAILQENKFPLDYVAFMWASYMSRTIDRRIHFLGRNNNQDEWKAFGEDIADGFETGTVGYYKSEPLDYEEDAKTLNVIEHPEKKFSSPFYYGLVHGSGTVEAKNDTMVYIMMFDQKEPIRFAMWNFMRNSEGKPDTHSPAWDWQYVIRNPKLNEAYSYQARIVYKPFINKEDVLKEYENWVDEMKLDQ